MQTDLEVLELLVLAFNDNRENNAGAISIFTFICIHIIFLNPYDHNDTTLKHLSHSVHESKQEDKRE